MRQVLQKERASLKEQIFQGGTNASLWLDKYLNPKDEAGTKKDLVDDAARIPVSQAYEKFYGRWEKMLDAIGVKPRKAAVKGRMIVGLGSESVLETSVALHRTYGVPYIPGSALKGLAASYVHQKLTDKWHKGSDAYKIVFGNTSEAGYITFFDALYVPGTGHVANGKAKGPLHPDVITVHHQNYYQGTGNVAPADWDSPIPVPFLSATGTYLIALAAPPEIEDGPEWIEATFKILGLALKEMGIGAKTSSGYGRMELEVPEPAPPPVDPEVQQAIDAAKIVEAEIKALTGGGASQMEHKYFRRCRDAGVPEARKIIARAIVEWVRAAGYEETEKKKGWYITLRTFL